MAIGLLLVATLPLVAAGDEDGSVPAKIHKATGTTDLMGGGDYVAIRFGNDAWFGVIYGTDKDPNSVIIYSRMARYLGMSNVKTGAGKQLASRTPIKAWTFLGMRMNSLVEYNDTDGDGICHLLRKGGNVDKASFTAVDQVFKAVNLNASWELSEVTKEKNNSAKWASYQFSLTARNLGYIDLTGGTAPPNASDVLDSVTFTFKLTAHVNRTKVLVPIYNITVKAGAGGAAGTWKADGTVTKTTKNVTGNVVRYGSKVDHDIRGWDFQENNANASLMLENLVLSATSVPSKPGKWYHMNTLRALKREGGIRFNGDKGNETLQTEGLGTGYQQTKPRRVVHPRMDISDEWERSGRLTWIKDVEITDGNTTTTEEMTYQVQGGKAFAFKDGERMAAGLLMAAGFNYPAGERIYHDPGVESQGFLGEEEEDEGISGAGLALFIPIVFMVLIMAVTFGVVLIKKV